MSYGLVFFYFFCLECYFSFPTKPPECPSVTFTLRILVLVVSYLFGFRWTGLTYILKAARLSVRDKLLQGVSTIINCTSEALDRSLCTLHTTAL